MSRTYIAAIATLVVSVTSLSEAEALDFVNAVMLVAGTLFTLWGRYQAGGINIFGKRD